MPKSNAYLINKRVDSLNKEELDAFIKIYQERILSIMEKVAEVLEEIRETKSTENSRRRSAKFYSLAKMLGGYLRTLRVATKRAEEAEDKLDELTYGTGRKSGDTLTDKQKRLLFGVGVELGSEEEDADLADEEKKEDSED